MKLRATANAEYECNLVHINPCLECDGTKINLTLNESHLQIPEGVEIAITAALDYIARMPQIWEVILTGGDPLLLPPRRLKDVMTRLTLSARRRKSDYRLQRRTARRPILANRSPREKKQSATRRRLRIRRRGMNFFHENYFGCVVRL